MSARRFYVTTTIPYVNGDPHLGHALEFVQADVLARHRRLRGDEVRFLTGTDDNALKNVRAAEAEGVSTAELVERNTGRFAALREPLQLSYDDFIRTSVERRHRLGAERLWQACAGAGDLYRRDYDGLYCVGCEAFLTGSELREGRCREHAAPPEPVAERNWFFRLSRYEGRLLEAIERGAVRIEPEARRNEVVALVRGGLSDFSVSRARERARGWGIPVPGDAGQVIYVWFDALANYVSALGYGEDGALYRQWWLESDERVHVIGKGVLRFHAVYWPAILLSAGVPLPTTILVHDYVTADGEKLSKSLANSPAPAAVVDRLGGDAFRWWLVRGVPRVGDVDFREELVVARADGELANGLGNLVKRTLALVARHRAGGVSARRTEPAGARPLLRALDSLPGRIDAALARFDLRAASEAAWRVVVEGNRLIERTRPWDLGRAASTGDADAADRLRATLSLLLHACELLTRELEPFLPEAAPRIAGLLADEPLAAARETPFPRQR
jgi:methionyl-tRNA synthetase